jgi:hypothetical protein
MLVLVFWMLGAVASRLIPLSARDVTFSAMSDGASNRNHRAGCSARSLDDRRVFRCKIVAVEQYSSLRSCGSGRYPQKFDRE